MKKRIFIAMHYMEIGGAEISLIGLLQAMDYTKYDVDLFIYSHQGELMQFIPKEVNLLPEIPSYAYIERPMKEALMHGQWGVAFGRLKAKRQYNHYLKTNHSQESYAVYQYIARNVDTCLPNLYKYGEYDLAISFLHPHNYVLTKVKAKKKICWIHTDYSTIDINEELELPVWSEYDKIVAISPDVRMAFVSIFPILESKIIVMENILSPVFVKQRAEGFDVQSEMKDDVFKILSIGRFSMQKNFDNVPEICKCILQKGVDIKWYIIGFGGDEQLIRQKIKEAGVEDDVIILGKKSNPYPYIKACDIYVQPSRYEGKSVTVREAQMLSKPVVVTDYPTAKSQIQDGVDGVIVPLDNEGCAKGLSEFIRNKSMQEQIVDYLKMHDYGNMGEVRKIYQLLEE